MIAGNESHCASGYTPQIGQVATLLKRFDSKQSNCSKTIHFFEIADKITLLNGTMLIELNFLRPTAGPWTYQRVAWRILVQRTHPGPAELLEQRHSGFVECTLRRGYSEEVRIRIRSVHGVCVGVG